ncbi:MAG: ATPase inhibitor subunit zeta [Asticcacaulis sp.]
MALWAAEKMGLSDEMRENYARALENYHAERPGEEDVIRKISGDLLGVEHHDARIGSADPGGGMPGPRRGKP